MGKCKFLTTLFIILHSIFDIMEFKTNKNENCLLFNIKEILYFVSFCTLRNVYYILICI